MVTADGELRRVDAESDPDLLWALKGGGGAFGVVCSLELALVEAGEMYGGMVAWPIEAVARPAGRLREWTATAPRELTSSLRFLNLPPFPEVPEPLRGNSVVALTSGLLGSEDEGREALAPMLGVATPLLDGIGLVPPAALSRIHGDPEQPTPGIADSLILDCARARDRRDAGRARRARLEQPVAGGGDAAPGRRAGRAAEDARRAGHSVNGAYALGFVGMPRT